ncbi:TonB-dependent receptor [Flavobacteriaceae bacterium]|nr:TonB-dependent receptor [Flavobacteriaceae bacterium]MDC0497226.1 TonB-dependent receptor [Flavobacteriaceae bacterium]MDC0623140.1 TonB-dependent receptor [Flavobacteriaceae bacterium]
MDIIHNGDSKVKTVPTTKQKALKINLNDNIYGTFAEIGAGQETVRQFFRAGGASSTIAKSISAYDKDFSDAIYGIEDDKRYVTENRLRKMLDWETSLIEQRLTRDKHPEKLFFSYANTVATIDFAKKFKGHGWVGLRFQIDPHGEYNEIILHIRFKENDARLQQETLGVLGTNLIYSAFYKYNQPKKILKYLYDNLNKDQLEIDTINFSGPVFTDVDNRLISLQLVKGGMTDAVMFSPEGKNVLPAKILYKKNILALRGSFRPVTKVNVEMYLNSIKLFLKQKNVDLEKTQVVFEITLSNLKTDGEIDEQDFLDRAKLLCSLGQTVLISDFKEYYKLVEYFSLYTKKKIGLTMGINNLIEIFDPKYYTHLSGGILEAFGKLFFKNVKVFAYPTLDKDGLIVNSDNLKVHPRMKELYKFFKYNGKVEDVVDYDIDHLKIFSREVLKLINSGDSKWEDMLPKGVSKLIKEQKLFGYK